MLPTRKFFNALFFWISCIIIFIPSASSLATNAELRVYHDIFAGYDSVIRPLRNSSHTVYVKVTYYLSSIDNVDEKAQLITLSGWLHLEWMDEFLTWDPEEYEGVDMIIVPPDKIWTPDLVFETGIKEKFFSTKLFLARIYSSGQIIWEPGGTIDLNCNYDLTYYPCDAQQCPVKLVTWTNTGSRVFSMGNEIDISNYDENGEWTLQNATMENYTFTEDGDSFTEVHFSINMIRKPLYQVLNILLPVTLLSVLNLLVFCIPPASGEKVSLSVTVLLAFSVWLLMMNGMMPSSSDYVPLMGAYITAFLVSSSVSVLISVIVLKIYEYPESRPIPPRVMQIILKISSIKWRLKCFEKNQSVYPQTPLAEITRLPNLDGPIEVMTSNESKKTGSQLALMEKEEDKQHKVTWHQVADAIDVISFVAFLLFFFVLTFVTVAILLAQFNHEY